MMAEFSLTSTPLLLFAYAAHATINSATPIPVTTNFGILERLFIGRQACAERFPIASIKSWTVAFLQRGETLCLPPNKMRNCTSGMFFLSKPLFRLSQDVDLRKAMRFRIFERCYGYFRSKEATIFSNRGSLRSVSQIGSSCSSPSLRETETFAARATSVQ